MLVYSSPATGNIDWAQRLKGVVFWQFPIVNGNRVIRSHGLKSILAMFPTTDGVEGRGGSNLDRGL